MSTLVLYKFVKSMIYKNPRHTKVNFNPTREAMVAGISIPR